MGAPRTRLDGFLRVVELDEDAAAVALAAAQRAVLSCKARCDELRAELRRDGRSRGPSQEWMVVELERQRLVEALRASEERLAGAVKAEQGKRVEMNAAHQKAETIRHAIERLRGEIVRDLTRKDQRESDEIAVIRHRRVAS